MSDSPSLFLKKNNFLIAGINRLNAADNPLPRSIKSTGA